ncbi:MAG TPA: HlyD family efflux transporter periplasmic adaptor subunit [Phycisphaerae bacterium]|nr:HlyD family efflux transporter periplasmic adaptor subunit [Phycisphaerae bacterium]
MIRNYLLPCLAVVGVIFAAWVMVVGGRPVPAAPPLILPAQPPFKSYVAGAGMIEASSENIAIAPVIGGIVTKVHVSPGSKVKAGDPLLSIDDRALKAQLAVRKTTQAMAQERLERLIELPRKEDIPPAQARLAEAQAALADAQNQLKLWESVSDQRAVSQDELNRRRFAVKVAEARRDQAQSELDLLKAGSWKADIEIAQSEVAAAAAQVKEAETEIDRYTTRVPVDGEILQVKVRPGEYAQTGMQAAPLILMGNLDRLHVRVDVDENDAWRINPGANAVAYVRGNRDMSTPISFVRIEPYVVPKRSLTGDSMERVDTRVLQIVFAFDRQSLAVYVGQQMDVFIEAPPVGPNIHMATTIRPEHAPAKDAQP